MLSRVALLLGVVTLASPSVLAQRATPPQPATSVPTLTNAAAAGHRLWVLFFDISSIQGDDVGRARDAAENWIDRSVDKHDLVSIETAGTSLTLLLNFTGDLGRMKTVLDGLSSAAASGSAPSDDEELQERDFFNNDLRYRSLRALCTGLRAIEQRKTIMFFTLTSERPGQDNQIEARGATDACSQANATVNPVDVRQPGRGRIGGAGGSSR